MSVRILSGDCLEVMPTLDADSVDAIVTDPPYHLTTGKKGGAGPASVSLASPHGRARVGTGFMGMKWDGGDVAFRVETWQAALRVLKPGGYLLAFGGTRTYHRLVCAIEDAGFEVRDMIAWLYGSGFPKGTDKAKIPEQWKGWNTALKPAIEPICMARKPMIGTLAENLERYGTGALWVDGCRIAVGEDDRAQYEHNASGDRGHADNRGRAMGFGMGAGSANALGRWPANVIHDGSAEVVELFPKEAGAFAPVRGSEPSRPAKNVYGEFARGGGAFHGDSGSAARFFYCAKADRADRNDGLHGLPEKSLNWSSGEKNPSSFQSPNTKRQAQNFHPTVKPTDLMRYLCRLVTPPGGTVLDPFMGSGSTLKAAELEGFSAIGIELNAEYVEIARKRIASDAPLFAEVA